MILTSILPGTGRWQRIALTEGHLDECCLWRKGPSTMLRMVPLPASGEDRP